MPNKFTGYQCSICGRKYSPGEVKYTCSQDGGNLDVLLDYEYIQDHYSPQDIFISKEFSLWRYLPLMPVNDIGGQNTPFRSAGWTPIYNANRLAEKLGILNVWVKDESKNPTASFKDRASAVVLARAHEIQAATVVTASTGNAGAALAGMAAAIGQDSVIFAPRTAPPAKIAQLLIYGARVYLVDGSYDDAFDLSVLASDEFGWYCRNTGYNPFTAEGKKTAAFEIWEWIHNLHFTDDDRLTIFVSVGDGNIISGLHKGFKDLFHLGWISKIPRIFGVQAEGSAAIANAFFSGKEEIIPVKAQTIADSISVDFPRDGIRAIRAARESHGSYLIVDDAEILTALADLGTVGIFAEPAGATSYAGLVKAVRQGMIMPNDQVFVINTGSGLKDIRSAMQAVQEPTVIDPTLKSLKKVMH